MSDELKTKCLSFRVPPSPFPLCSVINPNFYQNPAAKNTPHTT